MYRIRKVQLRSVAVALIGFLLAAVIVPGTSLASGSHTVKPPPHIIHPTDGIGDSPLVP
jgi:hypothetical protein